MWPRFVVRPHGSWRHLLSVPCSYKSCQLFHYDLLTWQTPHKFIISSWSDWNVSSLTVCQWYHVYKFVFTVEGWCRPHRKWRNTRRDESEGCKSMGGSKLWKSYQITKTPTQLQSSPHIWSWPHRCTRTARSDTVWLGLVLAVLG